MEILAFLTSVSTLILGIVLMIIGMISDNNNKRTDYFIASSIMIIAVMIFLITMRESVKPEYIF